MSTGRDGRGPEDTSRRDPLLHLVGMLDGSERYITDIEAAGQRQVVASSVLPRDKGDQAAYEALGFTFGTVVDDLFQEATLPPRWTKRGTEHDMHSVIVDERDIERVGVFYKAAFYDRSASMHVIDVGGHYAIDAIYRAGPVEGPWDVMTTTEMDAALRAARGYLDDVQGSPQEYGERASRALEVIVQINATLSESTGSGNGS